MMSKLAGLVLLICLALVVAEPRVLPRRGLVNGNGLNGQSHPYLFLSVPRGRAGGAVVQGFEVVGESNDEEDDSATSDSDSNADDDDDNEEEEELPTPRKSFANLDDDEDDDGDSNGEEDEKEDVEDHMTASVIRKTIANNHMQLTMKNAKPTHMMVPREHAGAIMVPDGIIEIEGQSVIDEKTGKAALLVPRSALDAIPDGSVVALMERSLEDDTALEEERANRVIVRRRRKGSRRNVKRRGGNRRRRGGNKNNRRRVNRRTNVRVVRTGGNRRRNVKRRVQRPMRIQG